MSRRGRYYESWCCYEICFRAKNSLPLAPNRLMRFILASIVARVQRDQKVILCHDVWNGSHPHLIVICQDADAMKRFYMELKKKITDVIKRLLGLEYLNTWEDGTTVAKLPTLEDVMDRIAYLYANVAQGNLESQIEKFPGLSSWDEFQACTQTLNATSQLSYPWLRLPSIPQLKSSQPDDQEYRAMIRLLTTRNRKRHLLERKPNVWMKCFGITTNEEVKEINSQIEERLRAREQAAAKIRVLENKSVMGVSMLESQPIMKPHTPKKKGRRIFIITSVKEIRISFIKAMDLFARRCKECYQCWKQGDFSVEWPPGAFKPPLPPNYNLLPMFE